MVDTIDLWVGVLAEDQVTGGSVGETAKAILTEQFERLRSADRFWYQRTFQGQQFRDIDSTRLSDVIRNNTTITNLQSNAFVFQASLSGSLFTDTNGNQRFDPTESPQAGLIVELLDSTGEVVATTTGDSQGAYSFDVLDGLRTGDHVIRTRPSPGASTSRSVM
jgi:peroxidase